MWCSPVPALPMGTRLGTGGHAAGGRRPPGGAWAGAGAHCDMGPAWVPGGLFPAEQPKHLRREAGTMPHRGRRHILVETPYPHTLRPGIRTLLQRSSTASARHGEDHCPVVLR